MADSTCDSFSCDTLLLMSIASTSRTTMLKIVMALILGSRDVVVVFMEQLCRAFSRGPSALGHPGAVSLVTWELSGLHACGKRVREARKPGTESEVLTDPAPVQQCIIGTRSLGVGAVGRRLSN